MANYLDRLLLVQAALQGGACRLERLPIILERGPCSPEALARAVGGLFEATMRPTTSDVLARLLINDAVPVSGADAILHHVHANYVRYLIKQHQANAETRFSPHLQNALERAIDYLDAYKAQDSWKTEPIRTGFDQTTITW